MRNVRLAMKIGGGFGVVLALACILGLVAVTRMSGARSHSERMKNEYVPEVIVANTLERHIQAVMYAMQGYISSGRDEFLTASIKEMGQVGKGLSEAQQLAEAFPGLVKLREGLGAVKERMGEYEKLSAETKTRMVALRTAQNERTRVATRILKRVEQFQKTAKTEFGEALAGDDSGTRLLRQWDGIDQSDAVLDSISAIRIKVLTGDARGDAKQYEEARGMFGAVKETVASLKAGARDPSQQEALDGIAAGVADYEAAVADQLKAAKALGELNDRRNKVLESVLEGVRGIAGAGTGRRSTPRCTAWPGCSPLRICSPKNRTRPAAAKSSVSRLPAASSSIRISTSSTTRSWGWISSFGSSWCTTCARFGKR